VSPSGGPWGGCGVDAKHNFPRRSPSSKRDKTSARLTGPRRGGSPAGRITTSTDCSGGRGRPRGASRPAHLPGNFMQRDSTLAPSDCRHDSPTGRRHSQPRACDSEQRRRPAIRVVQVDADPSSRDNYTGPGPGRRPNIHNRSTVGRPTEHRRPPPMSAGDSGSREPPP